MESHEQVLSLHSLASQWFVIFKGKKFETKLSRFLYLLHRLCQQVPSLVRCAKDSFSSTKEKYNMAFVKLSILRKLIPAYSSLLHSRRSKSKKRRSRNYISRGNPIVFIKYYYYHQKRKGIDRQRLKFWLKGSLKNHRGARPHGTFSYH